MEAEELIGKQLRIILTNDFHYSGTVIQDTPSFLIIKDKFAKLVTINKNNILVQEEVKDE